MGLVGIVEVVWVGFLKRLKEEVEVEETIAWFFSFLLKTSVSFSGVLATFSLLFCYFSRSHE